MEVRKKPRTASEAVQGIDLTGKVFLVTGAYSGLGAATARALISAGGKVIVAGRNSASQLAFAKELTTSRPGAKSLATANLVDADQVIDLGSLDSVRDFASNIRARYNRLDCLINNAGIMNTPAGKTRDGFEIQMGTNVIGHFLLAKLLAEITHRQVWLSSAGHSLVEGWPGPHDNVMAPRIDIDAICDIDTTRYDGWRRYQQSKLGNILLAKQFPIEFPHLKSCSVHPGVVKTNLSRHLSIGTLLKFVFVSLKEGPKAQTPDEGARTQTLCAVVSESDLVNGAYYANCSVETAADAAMNMEDAKRLYDFCDDATRPFQELA